MKPRLLYVEDDATARQVLERELRAFGYEVSSHETGERAMEWLGEHQADVALFDLRLPGMDGIELLEAAKERAPTLPVVFLTGHGSLPDAVRAMRAGAHDFLVKPAPLDELEITLQRALEHGSLVRRNDLLRTIVNGGATSEILGASPAMDELRASIAQIAASEANVLIFGENGTGKELVARAIHDAGPRREAAFVVVNCGAIPDELFESELFGHSRGAFTGANRRRLGMMELAEGGTLFLDEVGELPLAVQPALLRAVQFGEFRPVGAERASHADVRVVAATNRDLAEAVAAGTFREDLFHRLSTLGLIVPPLRERGDDVRILARALLERHFEKVPPERRKTLSDEALARLQAHPWTGNVRELENVVVRVATLVPGTTIEAADVEKHLRPIGGRPGAGPTAPSLDTLDLETLERQALVQALRKHVGHRERAAAELGIATKTLYNRIRHHGIAPDEWGGTPG